MDLLTVVFATTVALGCNDGSRTASLEADQPQAVGTAGLADDNDKAFVEQMAVANLAEIQLAQMAKQRAVNPEAKQFAEMMERDHTAGLNSLKQVASRHAIALPSQIDEKHREIAQHLSEREGEHFDRSYMRAMVEGHEDVVDLLQTRAKEDRFGENKGSVTPEKGDNQVEASLNTWAANTLKTSRHHLDEAKRIHLALENTFGPPAGFTPQSSSRQGH
jgi:putative membrane protein